MANCDIVNNVNAKCVFANFGLFILPVLNENRHRLFYFLTTVGFTEEL